MAEGCHQSEGRLMDWNHMLLLPMTVLLVLAAVFLLLTIMQAFALRRHLRDRRRVAAGARGVIGLACLALALLLGGTGAALRGYHLLGAETRVIDIDARKLAPQHWELALTWPDGRTRQVTLDGDDWRVEAIVLKWKLPALLAGVPPLYRLDRLSGRYDDIARESGAPHTVIGLGDTGGFDVLDLKRKYPGWLPEVDTVFGSGAYMPLVDGGHYSVSLMRTGALVARADDATRRKLGNED